MFNQNLLSLIYHYMKKRIAFIGLIIILSKSVVAQNTSSSPYSVFGPGILNQKSSALNRSLAGTGIGISNGYSINITNPASYVWIGSPFTQIFELGLNVESNSYSTSSFASSNTTGGLTGMSYWFRVKPWWASTLGLSPFSTVSYNIASSKTLAATGKTEYVYGGTGNTSQIYFGNSFKLSKNLSVGFNAGYIFGSINRTESISATEYTDGLTLNNKIFTNTLTLDYGLQYIFHFKNKNTLTLGATYDHSLKLNGRSELNLVNSAADTIASESGKKISYTIPAKYGGGISYRMKQSLFAADVRFQEWSKGNFQQNNNTLQDSWRYSLGYSYSGKEAPENYLQSVSLNAGLYYQKYFVIMNNRALPNYGFSVGVGLPVLDGKSTINLTYGYDLFGTQQDQLILQKAQRIMLEVVIRDIWGYRRKID
jgi:hypothetical protein